MAMLNGSMNVAAAIAPIIGSYITMYFHWQGNFTVLLILGMITLIMSVVCIPAYKLPEPKEIVSLYGYIPIFQSKPLMLLVVNIFIIFIPYWIFVGISPLLYIEGLGMSLSRFGYYQGSLAIVFALGNILFGMVIKMYDQKKILYIAN